MQYHFVLVQSHLNVDGFWMSLTDVASEGVWRWSTSGQVAQYTDWHPGEPNNYLGHDEDCAVFANWEGYDWSDVSCKGLYRPLCEIRDISTT